MWVRPSMAGSFEGPFSKQRMHTSKDAPAELSQGQGVSCRCPHVCHLGHCKSVKNNLSCTPPPSRHSARPWAQTPMAPGSPKGFCSFRKLHLHVQPLCAGSKQSQSRLVPHASPQAKCLLASCEPAQGLCVLLPLVNRWATRAAASPSGASRTSSATCTPRPRRRRSASTRGLRWWAELRGLVFSTHSHVPNGREWRCKDPDSGTICHLVAFLCCPLTSTCSVTIFISAICPIWRNKAWIFFCLLVQKLQLLLRRPKLIFPKHLILFFSVLLLRLDLATACRYLGSTPSISRETCSSTPWRATAQTPSSTWRWASDAKQCSQYNTTTKDDKGGKSGLAIAHVYYGIFYDF